MAKMYYNGKEFEATNFTVTYDFSDETDKSMGMLASFDPAGIMTVHGSFELKPYPGAVAYIMKLYRQQTCYPRCRRGNRLMRRMRAGR